MKHMFALMTVIVLAVLLTFGPTPALFAILYLAPGSWITGRAMAHVRENAFNDADFFEMTMAANAGSLSMLLPKASIMLFWPAALAVIAFFALTQPSALATGTRSRT